MQLLQLLLAFFFAVLSGCGSLTVSLPGSLDAHFAPEKTDRPALRFDTVGNPLLEAETKLPLNLPLARESERFGVSFVDASYLPSVWRPKHAAQGGVLVSAVR